jgi:peptidoglycan/LPS O-acetylase OafA/YrhL
LRRTKGTYATLGLETVSPAATRPLGRNAVTPAYVPEVDAVRGLAMTAVMALHCGILPFGWMGVWVFYVISGFAVATSLFHEHATGAVSIGTAIRRFYMRRSLRIWPLYFAFLAANVLILLVLRRPGPLGDLPWLVSFSHNFNMAFTTYTGETSWPAFGHLWTLSVEQQFYLLFPFILLLRSRKAKAAALIVVMTLALAMRVAASIWTAAQGWDAGRSAFFVYAFSPAHFDAFAAGAMIALFREELTTFPRLLSYAVTIWVVIGASHAGFYSCLAFAQGTGFGLSALRNIVSGNLYGQGREVSVYLIPTLAGAILILSILSRSAWCLRLCRLPGLQAFGRVSYGGYLFHIPILMVLTALYPQFTAGFGNRLFLFGLAVSCAYIVAWCSFHFFERRWLQLKRVRRLRPS